MEKLKSIDTKSPSLTVLSQSKSDVREGQNYFFLQPDFDGLEANVVMDNILKLLPKNDLEIVSSDKYNNSIAQPMLEGEKAVRQEQRYASEAYAVLVGYDTDLPPLLGHPTDREISDFLTR